MAAVTSKQGNGEINSTSDCLCGPCKMENKSHNAVGYCQYCRHYLCTSCFTYHKNLGKIHVLLNKDKMPEQKLSHNSSVDQCLETCHDHKHKVLELYCKNHDEVCCVICVTAKHKQCDYVYIPDYTETLHKSPVDECSNILNLIQALIGQLENIRSESSKRLKDLDKQKREFISAVRKFRKEIEEELDNLEKQIVSEMKMAVEIQNKQLTENTETCEDAIATLHGAYTNTQDGIEANGLNRVFTVLKIGSKMLRENTVTLKAVKDKSFNLDIKFDENFQILKTLRQTKAFGKVVIKKELVKFGEKTSEAKVKVKARNTNNNTASK